MIYDGVEIELRQAIEPWHVLGEEVTRQRHRALRRFVGGADAGQGDRHDRRPPRGACNGRPLPLTSTGVPRRIRRRRPLPRVEPAVGAASRPSACRRRWPSTWSTPGRSARWAAAPITSCIPGGRNYDTFPVNANEAEARRVARFWAHGHTPGPMRPAGAAEPGDAGHARSALAAVALEQAGSALPAKLSPGVRRCALPVPPLTRVATAAGADSLKPDLHRALAALRPWRSS